MREAPSNTDDVIDSRDVIARIEELQGEFDTLETAVVEAREERAKWDDYPPDDVGRMEAQDTLDTAEAAFKEWQEDETDEAREHKALVALQDAAEGYAPDWHHGATLIRRSYWPEYAEELVKDIGDMPKDLPAYIADNINWQGVADDLEVDYPTVDFDGVEYLIR